MDIKQIKYFVTIVEEGTISAAARKLYMSQPPLSYQMKLLEEELGCRLFERGGKTVILTKQGEIFYKRAMDVLSLMRVTNQEIKEVNSVKTIRIGVVSSLIEMLVNEIRKFNEIYDDVRFEISEGNTYAILDKLDKGLISLAIVRKPYSMDVFDEKTIKDDYLVAVGKNLPKTVDFSYLSDKDLIVYRRWNEIIENEFVFKGLSYNNRYLNDDARTSLMLAGSGMGIALVPKSSTYECKEDVREIIDCKLVSQIVLLNKSGIRLSDTERAFIDSMSD